MKFKSMITMCVISIILAGCTLPFLLSPSKQDSAAVAAQKATIVMQITMTADSKFAMTPATPTEYVVPTTTTQCAYVWALNPDVDLNDQLSNALSAGLREKMQLSTSWYGENCLNVDTNEVIKFTQMNLELTASFYPTADQTDAWKGDQIVIVMNELETLINKTADLASYPLMMHFIFSQDGSQEYLNFTQDTYTKFHEDDGLSGEALYLALRP